MKELEKYLLTLDDKELMIIEKRLAAIEEREDTSFIPLIFSRYVKSTNYNYF